MVYVVFKCSLVIAVHIKAFYNFLIPPRGPVPLRILSIVLMFQLFKGYVHRSVLKQYSHAHIHF